MNMRESLEKILESEELFGNLFYDIFFKRHPEAASHFEGIDMRRQALMLTMALTVIEQYYSKSFSAVEQYLQLLGSRHSDRSIPREMYPKWSESMLVALESFHGEAWDEQLAENWSEALDKATAIMFRGYERRMGI